MLEVPDPFSAETSSDAHPHGWMINGAIMKSINGSRNVAWFDLACQLRDRGETKLTVEQDGMYYVAEVNRENPKEHEYTVAEMIASVESAFSQERREHPAELWERRKRRGVCQSGQDSDASDTRTRTRMRDRSGACVRAELRELLEAHQEGSATLAEVAHLEIPLRAPALCKTLYRSIILRLQLRMGAEMPEDRPLPYATSEAVADARAAGFRADKRNCSRALHWLEDQGLIWSPGRLEPRGAAEGTRTFLPGPRPEVVVADPRLT